MLALGATLLLALPPSTARGAHEGATATRRAEDLASEAVQLAPRDPAAALERARRALALTDDFEPTAFVAAGRKGEVVEDAFQAARVAYRRHRALLYTATGGALLARGDALASSRYLRRALLLEPTAERALALAEAEIQLARGRAALEALTQGMPGFRSLSAEAAQLVARAADVAGLPSAQAEIDRVRLSTAFADRITVRDGPLALPPDVRLSTAAVFRLEDAPLTAVYAAEPSCRSCSTDLDAIARQVPPGVRVLALPPGDDQDHPLRQVLALYRRPWPLLLGPGLAGRLSLEPRSVLLVARGGWTMAVLGAPFADLAAAVALLQKSDVSERVPRAGWNRRPLDRSPVPGPPGLLPEGLAPGEDEPFPEAFERAVSAFRAGRPADALAAFESLEAKGDGWLLPPEARLDRALCLARLGRSDAARRLLLRTGDSRFENAIDRLLEEVAARR